MRDDVNSCVMCTGVYQFCGSYLDQLQDDSCL